LLGGILPLILCIGLLRVNRIAWYTLFGFVFLLGIRDLKGLHFLAYVISLSYFINPRIKQLYFDPKLQWWRQKRRYEANGPTIVETDTKTFYPHLKNISEGGCFLETPHTQEEFEHIWITIPLPSPLPQSSLKLKGEVRWVSSDPEKVGMGIQFISASRSDRLNLKKFIAQQ
ncbi:PilZ domain-containing protein, partial [bacterium]|nr:PilZ domain-containing protein [bacterium]